MTFLFPLYLLGALAIALPVYLHLRRQPPRDQVDFGSLMFLEKTPVPHSKRRVRVEDLLLLFLRCLALLLLALIFGRPFIREKNILSGVGGKDIVVLLDRSASMQREDVWEEAIGAVDQVVGRMGQDDRLALYVFDDAPRPVFNREAWESWPAGERAGRVKGILAGERPGWSGTDLGLALTAAADELSGIGGGVTVVSDTQSGADLEALRAFNWPEDVTVNLAVVGGETGNASLQWIAGDGEPKLRLTNSAVTEVTDFQIGWQGRGERLTVVVPPGQSRVVPAPGRDGDMAGTLVLEGDLCSFDDTLYWAPPGTTHTRVQVLGKGLAEGTPMRLYLGRALQSDPLRTFTTEDVVTDGGRLYFVAGEPEAEEAAVLLRNVRGGAVAVVVLGGAGGGGFLRDLLGEGATVSEARVQDYALLEKIDYNHPIMEVFTVPGSRDFSKIHFWKHRVITLPENTRARVMASFDSGDPAWLEAPVGDGRVVVFAAGWQPGESQLALSSKFVPLLYSTLEFCGVLARDGGNLVSVGESPVLLGSTAVVWPGGESRSYERGAAVVLRQPGLYTFTPQGGQSYVVATNLPPSESDLKPLPPERFENFGIVLADSATGGGRGEGQGNEEEVRASVLESRQKLWRWFVLALLVTLIVETAVAGSRYRNHPTGRGEVIV